MKWWERLALLWEAAELRSQLGNWVRVIWDNENPARPYMIRYYLLSTRWIDEIPIIKNLFWFLSFRLVLHNMVKSDQRALHDHPWAWASYILTDGYWETTPNGTYWREPGKWRFRSAKSRHYIELTHESESKGGVWTLFLMLPRERDWGFVGRDGSWIPWQQYCNAT